MTKSIQVKTSSVNEARQLYTFCKNHNIKTKPKYYYRFDKSPWYCIDHFGVFEQIDSEHPDYHKVSTKDFLSLILRYKNNDS